MLDIAFYLVSEWVAQRTGVIEQRYRIEDGRFVLDTKDLSRIRLTSDEFITGLQGVEKVSEEEAMHLIDENHYAMGTIKPQPNVQATEEPNEEAQVGEESEQIPQESETPSEETPTDTTENQQNAEQVEQQEAVTTSEPTEPVEEETQESEQESETQE